MLLNDRCDEGWRDSASHARRDAESRSRTHPRIRPSGDARSNG